MTQSALSVQSLSKQFRLGARDEGYRTLRETMMDFASSPLRRLRRIVTQSEAEKLWALRDVSFDVKPGEVLGVIGRNGAGKSTLLKVLSRITKPTHGLIRVRGRVASLLEVGTGFHPELTGRENIYLNGAILGMSRREIVRKFDEIVHFAEVERFIDTPVKRYSSGMYLRLAFAVAAHLEPEILLVDEVLAVGDIAFQKKCIGKMEEVGKGGRTVLFVSHNMPAVLRLCNRLLLLDGGRVVGDGEPRLIAAQYLSLGANHNAERRWDDPNDAPGDGIARIHLIRLLQQDGQLVTDLDIASELFIQVDYWITAPGASPTALVALFNDEGVVLFQTSEAGSTGRTNKLAPGLYSSICRIPGSFFAEGRIVVLAAVVSHNPDILHACVRDAVSCTVVDAGTVPSVRGSYTGEWPGVLRPKLDWSCHRID